VVRPLSTGTARGHRVALPALALARRRAPVSRPGAPAADGHFECSGPAPLGRLFATTSRRIGRAFASLDRVRRATAHVALAAIRATTQCRRAKAIGSSRRPEGVPRRWLRRQQTSGPTGRPGGMSRPSTARGGPRCPSRHRRGNRDRGRWRGRVVSVSVWRIAAGASALAGRSDRVADGLSTREPRAVPGLASGPGGVETALLVRSRTLASVSHPPISRAP
jgi:hypothetical protein